MRDTRLNHLERESTGILVIRHLNPGVHTIGGAEQNLAVVAELTNHVPPPILLDIRGTSLISPAVRQRYTQRGVHNSFSALAILIDVGRSTFVGNLLLRVFSRRLPVRLFHVEHEAREWLSMLPKPTSQEHEYFCGWGLAYTGDGGVNLAQCGVEAVSFA